MKALSSGGQCILRGGVKGDSYMACFWSIKTISILLFLFFVKMGAAMKLLVSGIWGGASEMQVIYGFFSRLKPTKFRFIHFVVKKLVTLIIKGVGDEWEQKVCALYEFHAYLE
jgi:hypothetical protein